MAKHPKIQKMRVRPVCVPMEQPHKTAGGIITESPLVLTDIFTTEGVVGHSMVFTYTKSALKPTAGLIQNFEDLILDNPVAPATIEQTLNKSFRLLGTQGLVGMALAAIDMALWDAQARLNNQSLIQLLGGIEKSIPAYGGIGYDGAKESAKVAEDWAKRGYTGVKAKIGYPSIKEEMEVIRTIKNAVGNDIAVMVDYNQCLTPTEAVQRLRILDQEGLTWVEEPTLAHDYSGHAAISRESQTPIQCGENWWGILDMKHAIEAKATDFIMLDVMKIGGVTGWLKAAALGQAHNIQLSSHLWAEISAQLLNLTPTAHWLEYTNWWNPILAEPLSIENGMAKSGNALGTGITWDETAVSQFVI